MLNLRDKIIRGIITLFLIAVLCAGVAHLVNNPLQPEAGGRYQLAPAAVMAENAAVSPGANYGLHLNTGLGNPLSACSHCISTSQDGRETSLTLSFLCELLC